jgi:hypothetical protein
VSQPENKFGELIVNTPLHGSAPAGREKASPVLPETKHCVLPRGPVLDWVMRDKLPISVLIPTRNCAAFLPSHVHSLQSWIHLAEEVVVVDSESKDGTVEFLRQRLDHPRVKFLDHPPGLYQSWNFGIQNTTSKYVYISTVGDLTTHEGVEHLFDVAERWQCDVVVSKPRFTDELGTPARDDRWPIDEALTRLRVEEPVLLSPAEQFMATVTNTWGALLGSSASNLYRRDFLSPRPFPTDYGTCGDVAWGIIHVFDAKIAVTPKRVATFRWHEKSYSLSEYKVDSLEAKFCRLAQKVATERRAADRAVAAMLEDVGWLRLGEALEAARVEHDRLKIFRRPGLPWVLRPQAWIARQRRNRARKEIVHITDRVLNAERPTWREA